MTFEDRLLTALRTEVAERATQELPQPPGRLGRRLLLSAAVVAIAAAALVAVPVLTGSQAPAYALTRHADGSISVQINELRDPGRLEADLARLGVRVDIAYQISDLACPGGRFAASQPPRPGQREELADRWLVADGKKGFRIYPRRIPPGRTPTLRVDVDVAHPDMMWVGDGPPPPCQGR
jgi:hypothetical protein